jgi:hypothetical protein
MEEGEIEDGEVAATSIEAAEGSVAAEAEGAAEQQTGVDDVSAAEETGEPRSRLRSTYSLCTVFTDAYHLPS